jgi:6-phosphogluconolactonase
MAWVEHEYPDVATLTAAVAARLRDACADALADRGKASLALAGGKTPLPIYRALAEAPLDWPNVVAMPGDDRCVAHAHAASNVAALREAFSAARGLVVEPLTAVYGDPAMSLNLARIALARHREAFDAVVLGMGEDAHTASLFPGAVGVQAAMAPDAAQDAFAIIPEPLPPEAPFPRITLGLARLLRAREIHLIVTGARKREVLRAAQAAYDPLRMPISAVLHAPDTTVHIHWSP